MILASASPRRRELLAMLTADFTVRPSDVPEELDEGPLPDAVAALALRKARAVAAGAPGSIVLGADTIVVLDGDVLGKPADPDEARRMLARLRGRAHLVISGVAVMAADTGEARSTSVVSRVFMARVDDAVIAEYVRSGEPLDKAGAYAIQGLGGALVVGLIGSYSNVIGLPLGETRRLLAAFGVPLGGATCATDARGTPGAGAPPAEGP